MSFYEDIKSKVNRRKEVIKIKVEINKIENRKQGRINELKAGFEISKVNKPLDSLTCVRKKTQITNIRNERGNITTDSIHIKTIIRDYYE